MLIAAGIGVLAVITVSVFHLFFNRIIREKERFHQQQILHGQELLVQTVKTQEREREYIAGELHDAVGNKLNLLSMWINHRNLFPAAEYESLISEELSGVITATRGISHQLFPTRIDKIGLLASIEELLLKLYPVFQLNMHLPKTLPELGFEREIQLYRILQEVVNNSIRHSCATQIFLHIRNAQQFVQVIAGDNGTGFEAVITEKSIGLRNIETRLLSLKAVGKWKSTPGKGSRIIICIPHEEF